MTESFDEFLNADAKRETLRVAGVDYALLYVDAFVRNPAGARLLADWDERLARKTVATNAPITEYAANNAVREFVNNIKGQIQLAQTEGR